MYFFRFNGSRHGLGAAGVASNIMPDAADAVNLHNKHHEHLDSIMNDAAFRADQDGLRLSLVAVGFSNAEGGGMCVGVVNNDSILGGTAIVNDGIAATHAVHTDAAGGGRC